jgi:integrase
LIAEDLGLRVDPKCAGRVHAHFLPVRKANGKAQPDVVVHKGPVLDWRDYVERAKAKKATVENSRCHARQKFRRDPIPGAMSQPFAVGFRSAPTADSLAQVKDALDAMSQPSQPYADDRELWRNSIFALHSGYAGSEHEEAVKGLLEEFSARKRNSMSRPMLENKGLSIARKESVSKGPAPNKKTKPKKARWQMEPFSRESLQLIRASLKAQGATRDSALLSTGVDSMLRCGDLLRLRVLDVRDHVGGIRERFNIVQEKTGATVQVTLTPKTREALAELIAAEGKWLEDYLFTPEGKPHDRHISEVLLRRIVKGWARIAHLDPRRYSGHSLRRSKAVLVYRETRNVAAVSRMLGHSSLAHTLGYLGVREDEVFDLARKFDI